jgi:hypothetical protein
MPAGVVAEVMTFAPLRILDLACVAAILVVLRGRAGRRAEVVEV